MRVALVALVLTASGCATWDPYFYCMHWSDTQEEIEMCHTAVENTGDATCYSRHWVKESSRSKERFELCVFGKKVETAAERRARLERESALAEQAQKTRCADEVKKYGGDFWDCMRFYRDGERDEAVDVERVKARQRAQDDEDDEVIAEGIRNFGEALKPKPTTTCTTRPDAFGGVTTVCQ